MKTKRRKIRLSETRQGWAEARGGAVFTGRPLAAPTASEARFKRDLDKLVDRMLRETDRELRKLYRQPNAPTEAMDASFASEAARVISALQKRFSVLFSNRAGGLAEALAKGIDKQSANGLGESLKELSGGVTFKTDVVSGAVADVIKAGVKQNVALIKSIQSEYFTEIEGAVMRSIQSGRGMADLVPELEKREGITKRRARLIARDQTSKATTAINKARMDGLGIKKFKWLHSGGGKEPRRLHRDELNGKVFNMDDPPVIDERTGERGLPGQLINCFTGSTKVSLTNGCRNLWRYWHAGDIVRVSVKGHPAIEATLNHPILTGRGWLRADEVQEGDYLASSQGDNLGVVNGHDAEDTVAFADLYVALVLAGNAEIASGAKFDFHGDIPKSEVDCVSVEPDLSLRLKSSRGHDLKKLVFPTPDGGVLDTVSGGGAEVLHPFGPSVAGEGGSLGRGHFGEPHPVGSAPIPQENPGALEHIADHLPGAAVEPGYLQNAGPGVIHGDDGRGVASTSAGGFLGRELVLEAILEGAREVVGADAVSVAKLLEGNPSIKGFHRVEKKDIIVFAGHVYTMETDVGWYPVASTATISKNCRCRLVPVVDFTADDDE